MKRLLTILALFLPVAAVAQVAVYVNVPVLVTGPNVPISGQALPQALLVANGTVAICQHPSTINSCVPVPTYNDQNEDVACPASTPLVQVPGNTCTQSTGILGRVGFWYAGGTVDYIVTSPIGTLGPYVISVGGGGGGSGCGTGTANYFLQWLTGGTRCGNASMYADSTGNQVLTANYGTSVNFVTPQTNFFGAYGVAGAILLKQGTATSAPTNEVQIQAPSSISAYTFLLPGTQGQGCLNNDGSGNGSWLPDCGSSGLQPEIVPPTTGQYVIIYPSTAVGSGVVGCTNGQAFANGTSASGSISSTACGSGGRSVQAEWTNFSLPSYVNPANVTAVYPFEISNFTGQVNEIMSGTFTCGLVGSGYLDYGVVGNPESGPGGTTAAGSYVLQQVTSQTTTITGAQISTMGCLLSGSGSTFAVPYQATLNVASVGAFVYYTGTAPPSTNPLITVPPLYYVPSNNSLNIDMSWPFPGLYMLPTTLVLALGYGNAGSPVGTLFGITDGNSATDCSTGGGSNYVLCRWNGTSLTAYASGTNVEVNGGSALGTANFANSTGAGEIDFTNPSGSTVNATLHNTATTVNGQTCALGSTCTISASVGNALTMNNGGSGATPGTTFDGSVARTISYNTIGAAPASTAMTSLTGDVTGTGPGATATTLATVNSGPGSCGDATHVCQVTTNGKGLVTAQSQVAIAASGGSFSTLTGGTNTTAAMVVGSGASLAASGSGIINATAENGVSCTGTPTSGQVCVATGSTTATWQTPSPGAISWATPTAGTATSIATFPSGDLFMGGIDHQTVGPSYTIRALDENQVLSLEYTGGAIPVSLPAATTTGFGQGAVFHVINNSANIATITPTTSTINGVASIALGPGSSGVITSDGTNYSAELGAPLGCTANCSFGTIYVNGTHTFSAGGASIQYAVGGNNEMDFIDNGGNGTSIFDWYQYTGISNVLYMRLDNTGRLAAGIPGGAAWDLGGRGGQPWPIFSVGGTGIGGTTAIENFHSITGGFTHNLFNTTCLGWISNTSISNYSPDTCISRDTSGDGIDVGNGALNDKSGSVSGGAATFSSYNQEAASNTGGTCSMSTSTSCTITLGHTYTTPVCIATVQSATLTGGVFGCTVSGTTVTITAAVANSLTWGALVFGNPN